MPSDRLQNHHVPPARHGRTKVTTALGLRPISNPRQRNRIRQIGDFTAMDCLRLLIAGILVKVLAKLVPWNHRSYPLAVIGIRNLSQALDVSTQLDKDKRSNDSSIYL